MTKNDMLQLPAELVEAMSSGVGVVLKDFNLETLPTSEEINTNIIFATSGGITLSIIPELKDLGDGLDNGVKGIKELQEIIGWESKLAGTGVTVNKDALAMLLGGSYTTSAPTKADQLNISQTPSFTAKIWYVVPYGTQGGFIAAELFNIMNIAGFTMTTVDKDKNTFPFEFRAHSSLQNPRNIPVNLYMKSNAAAAVMKTNLMTGEQTAVSEGKK